jgi:hypothetical protein
MSAHEGALWSAKRRISLAEIDAAVSARLGPARVRGNSKPAVFNRQIAMYLASRIGGWSTTQIGKFYNGRDHSTVCYSITRVEVLRQSNSDIESLLTALYEDIQCGRDRTNAVVRTAKPTLGVSPGPPFEEEFLEALADRLAARIVTRLGQPPTIGSAGGGVGKSSRNYTPDNDLPADRRAVQFAR